jgi:hypothetical protein
METFTKAGEEHFQADIRGARGVDGKPVEVLGDGIISFQLSGRQLRERARFMKSMAEPMILSSQFMRRQNFPPDEGSRRATFWKMVAGAKVMFGGTVAASSARGLRSESVRAVADLDIEDDIDALELDIDYEEAEPELRAVLRAHRVVFSGVGKAKGVGFDIELKDDADALSIDIPTRRRSPAELALKKEAVERLIREGILDPSRAPAVTLNVFVEKMTCVENGRREMRTATDFRRLSTIRKSDAYPLEYFHAIV